MLTTVPTPPDYVSGGDVLVRIDVVPGIEAERVTLSVEGGSVQLAPAPSDRLGREGHALLALASGLAEGTNEIIAAVDGAEAASITVTNYPHRRTDLLGCAPGSVLLFGSARAHRRWAAPLPDRQW